MSAKMKKNQAHATELATETKKKNATDEIEVKSERSTNKSRAKNSKLNSGK